MGNAYPLGYSEHETKRLQDQSAAVDEHTESVLRRAGLRSGMHVLDVGSGGGDVSLLVAKIVGEAGTVLGVERAASSVEAATNRVRALGAGNISFEVSELATFETERAFDAIVGRFVLAYVPERVAVLRRLVRALRAGGIVVFQELDMSPICQVPPSELFEQARRWVLDAFTAGGAEVDMGTQLFAAFRAAGLPAPAMTAATPVVGGANSIGYTHLVLALRSLLPKLESTGVTSASIGVDTLLERLREDAAAHDRVMFASRIVSAWTRWGERAEERRR
jgi:protein-L-isoaspartate O-methyltransferase